MFTKNKVFAYENSDGDKGIIIARSINEAEKIFHEKYPERKIVDNYYDYSHGWEIRFDMENNFEEVDDSFSYTRSELYLSREDAKKVLKRRYLIKAIEKSLHDMSWSTFDGISDQTLQNLHTALIAVEKERIVLKK